MKSESETCWENHGPSKARWLGRGMAGSSVEPLLPGVPVGGLRPSERKADARVAVVVAAAEEEAVAAALLKAARLRGYCEAMTAVAYRGDVGESVGWEHPVFRWRSFRC